MTRAHSNRLHRVALLGLGRISRLAHLEALARHPAVSVVAVADPDADGLEFATRHVPHAQRFSDFRALLGEVEADAVIIALPTPLHREAALSSLAAGANVYLEKPIAASLDEARDIHDTWRATGLVGRIGFNCRFNRLYTGMKSNVSRGDIGKPVAVRTALTSRWPEEAGWRVSPASGGGALLELASHHFDLMRFMFDTEIASIHASTWSNRGEDEAAMLQVQLRNGIHAQTLVCYGTREEDTFEVYGSEGKLTIDRYDSLIVDRKPARASGGIPSSLNRFTNELRAVRYGMEKRRAPGQEPSYAESIGAFIADSLARNQGAPDFSDGLRALEAVDAARRSAGEQRPVELA